MIGILVMLNDYFHDFATALAVVFTYLMLSMVTYVLKNDKQGPKTFLIMIYPKALHVTSGVVILLLMAGIVRAFTYSWFEWDHTVGGDQVWLLMAKHILMFSIFGYGVYLWIRMHKTIKHIRDRKS